MTIPNIQALIFDMDGVLVDTEPIHIRSFQIFMDELNLNYDIRYIHGFVGYSIDQNVRRINRDFLKGREIPVDEGVRRRDAIYLELLHSTPLAPLPGVMELMEWCETNHVTPALASSSWKDQVEAILNLLETNDYPLRSRFQSIVHGDHVQKRKPAPDIYLKTVSNLNLPAHQCWAIEDSGAGVQSAKAAGVHCIGLKTPFITSGALKEADVVVPDLLAAKTFLTGKDHK